MTALADDVSADSRRAILEGLSSYVHPTYRVERDANAEKPEGWVTPLTELRQTEGLEKAQLVASTIEGTSNHTVMLDLDVPAKLVPSTTPGHTHLYIDVPMTWAKYERLLYALAEAGVIEQGYYRASVEREHTALRLPWVMKRDDDGLKGSA